eukprot:COSAG02_NODE_36071_length_459_cov_1.150000_1_plen_69_part_00
MWIIMYSQRVKMVSGSKTAEFRRIVRRRNFGSTGGGKGAAWAGFVGAVARAVEGGGACEERKERGGVG